MAETQKEFNFKIHGKTYKPAILDNDTLYVPDKNINPALKPEEATYSDIDNAFPSDYFFSELIKGELDTLDDLNVIENPNYMDTYFIKSEGRYYRCDEDGYFYPWVKTLDGLTEDDIIHALGYAPLSEADMNVIYDEIDNIFNSELPDVIKGSKASMSALNSLTDSVPGDIWFVVSEGKYYKFSIDGNWSEWSTVRSAITKEDLGLGNVENKSSETIRNEITSDDVVHALGFKPLTDEVNFDFESIRNELAGKVGKSGNKVLTDNNLSDELKGKYDDAVNKAHTHSNKNILDNTTESFTTEKNNKINTNETNISTLAKHVKGELTDSDFSEDSTAVTTKTVPTGMSDYAAVKSIGGRTQKMVQKIGFVDSTSTIVGVTIARSNGVITYNGTSTSTTISPLQNGLEVKPNHKYYFTQTTTPSGGGHCQVIIYKNETDIEVSWTSASKRGLFTAPATLDHAVFRVHILKDNTYNNYKMIPQLFDLTEMGLENKTIEELDEIFEPMEYVPQTSELWNTPVKSVVSNNKNIFDKSLLTNTTQIEGGFSITGPLSTLLVYTDNFKPNTSYSISCETYNTKSGDNYRLQVVYTDGTTSGDELLNANTSWGRRTLTTPNTKTIKEIRKTFSNNSGGSANYRYFQIEEGTAPTSYIKPYKTTLLLPDSDRSLPCFGCGIDETIQNVRDYENGTYTQMVAEVDLGDLSWVRNGDDGNRFYCDISTMKASSAITNGICSLYNRNPVDWKSLNDKDFCLGQNINSKGANIAIRDDRYTDATAFKEAMKGVKLVYELATPVVTDCSDMLHPIRVEAGGTITFTNEHSLNIPNTIVYKKEVSLS